jgi:hypothetical protein
MGGDGAQQGPSSIPGQELTGEDRIREIVAASTTVPGWTEGEDARRLVLAALEAEDDATIVAIGAFMGRCTVLLGAACRLRGSGKVFSFDPFDCSGDAFSVPHYRDIVRAAGAPSLEAAFRRNIASLGLDPWVEASKATAAEGAANWVRPIDLLLLDGDQSPQGARDAFERWVPFLKRGGTIVLRNTRDRNYAEGHDGHRRLAVEELVPPRFSDIRQVGATTFALKAV